LVYQWRRPPASRIRHFKLQPEVRTSESRGSGHIDRLSRYCIVLPLGGLPKPPAASHSLLPSIEESGRAFFFLSKQGIRVWAPVLTHWQWQNWRPDSSCNCAISLACDACDESHQSCGARSQGINHRMIPIIIRATSESCWSHGKELGKQQVLGAPSWLLQVPRMAASVAVAPPSGAGNMILSRTGILSPSTLVVLHDEVEAEQRSRSATRAAATEAAAAVAVASAQTRLLAAQSTRPSRPPPSHVHSAAAPTVPAASKTTPTIALSGAGNRTTGIRAGGVVEVAPFQTRRGTRSR
jgi:hypothetical protein